MAPASDLPPAYHTLKEEATTEQNAAVPEVTIPVSQDAPENFGVSFEDKDSRIGFIQKVIAIKLLQVLVVTFILVFFAVGGYSIYRMMSYSYSDTRTNFIVVSTLALLGTLGLLHYCDEVRYTKPFNFMFLVAYPASAGFFISVVTYNWGLSSICIAWVLFNFAVFALLMYSVFALQSKIEFKTSIGLYITAGTLIVGYALTAPFLYINAFGVLYCCLMMFLLAIYMLNDIQAMTSSTYRIHLTPSDFVKGALIMHIDYRYMIMKLYKKSHSNSNVDPSVNDAA